jgi:hypothetical protein
MKHTIFQGTGIPAQKADIIKDESTIFVIKKPGGFLTSG